MLLWVVVDVASYLVFEITGLLVTNYGSLCEDFLCGFWIGTVNFGLKSFYIWPFLPHLRQVKFDLVDDPPPDPPPFTLWWILKSTWFKTLLTIFSIAKVYSFGSEGWYWDFSLTVAVSCHFGSTRSRYSRIYFYKRDPQVISSSVSMTSMSHTWSFLINSVTSLYFWISQIRYLESEVFSKMRVV